MYHGVSLYEGGVKTEILVSVTLIFWGPEIHSKISFGFVLRVRKIYLCYDDSYVKGSR